MRRLEKWVSMVFAWILCLTVFTDISLENPKQPEYRENVMEVSAEEKTVLNLHAQSAVLMDADSGRVLYGKEEELKRPMASTTKIMTCILALENGKLDDVVTASKTAAAQPKVHLGVREGESFYLKDLLYSLMLESHNDSAVMIAEHIGGTVEGFAEMMNQKARDLGCENTFFITPNGLDAREAEQFHSTTAKELALIMRYCIFQSPAKNQFLEITRTQNYHFADTEKKRSMDCVNHNALLTTMEGAVSGKTGFTGGAGYCYVGAVESEGRKFVIALLGCGWPPHKAYKWADAGTLIRHGKENFTYQQVWKEPEFAEIPVKNGIPDMEDNRKRTEDIFEKEGSTTLVLGEKEERSQNVLMSESDKIEIQKKLPEQLKAPVKEGDTAGSIIYLLNGEVIRKIPVYIGKTVEEKDLRWYGKKIYFYFLL